MILRDLTLNTPAENILFDEVLLDLAEQNHSGEALRFWESPAPFVVLGRTGKIEQDVYIEKVNKDRLPVLRRASGGGTVLQGPGCCNFSLIIAKDRHPQLQDLRKSYRFILENVLKAFTRLRIEAVFHPIADLALPQSDQKISGNAQKRGRNFILHHGTILYAFDLKLIEMYLKIPPEAPEYRRGRSHLEFVANVPLAITEFKKELQEILNAKEGPIQMTEREEKKLKELLISRNLGV